MIGFDRSAFVAGPDLSGLRQSKCEPRYAAIHDEGLPELPIKNSNPGPFGSRVTITITRWHLSKRLPPLQGRELEERQPMSITHVPGFFVAVGDGEGEGVLE